MFNAFVMYANILTYVEIFNADNNGMYIIYAGICTNKS